MAPPHGDSGNSLPPGKLIEQYLFIVRVLGHCFDGKMFANTDVRRSALKVIDGLKGLLVLE
jgi:hypothetical protein